MNMWIYKKNEKKMVKFWLNKQLTMNKLVPNDENHLKSFWKKILIILYLVR